MKTTQQIKTTSNKAKRTYTIQARGEKYRTLPMTLDEFNEAEYFTASDWQNFLNTSQAYYSVK